MAVHYQSAWSHGHIDPRRGAQPPKMWRFDESRCMMQNVNKAIQAGETSHWTHSTCVRLRRWENQRRLSGLGNPLVIWCYHSWWCI